MSTAVEEALFDGWLLSTTAISLPSSVGAVPNGAVSTVKKLFVGCVSVTGNGVALATSA
jgi:hypothetical protein